MVNALMPAPMRLGKLLRWSKEEITSWLDAGAPDREQWNQVKAQQQG
jgi:predicted DNA-binding transcriptional regulator AlpA